MNVLLTGANGQLGRAVQHALEVNAQALQNEWTATTKKELDITDADAVEKYVLEHHINIIVNCAAYTNVNGAENDEATCRAVNVDGAKNLADAASKNGALLIHFSTDYVFNGMTFKPYEETRQTMPVNVYGQSKLDAEKAIIDSGCNYLIFRLQGLYSIYKPNFFSAILQKAKNCAGTPMKVVYDQITGIVNAVDVATALLEITEGTPGLPSLLSKRGIYHLSDKGCASWYDYAVYACRYLGVSYGPIVPVTATEYKKAMRKQGVKVADRPYYSVLSKEKFIADFGSQIVLHHWSQSLNNFLDELKKQWETSKQ